MKVTSQMMAKLEKCKSVEDLLELAKQENISLPMDQAQKALELLQSESVSGMFYSNLNYEW